MKLIDIFRGALEKIGEVKDRHPDAEIMAFPTGETENPSKNPGQENSGQQYQFVVGSPEYLSELRERFGKNTHSAPIGFLKEIVR